MDWIGLDWKEVASAKPYKNKAIDNYDVSNIPNVEELSPTPKLRFFM